jgi:protein SCO1/2
MARSTRSLGTALAAVAALTFAGAPASALPQKTPPPTQDAATPPSQLVEVGYDQKLGDSIPLNALFRDEEGNEVRLGELLRGRPIVLSVVYYECPMLCTLILNGAVSALKPLALTPGKDFDFIAVSFDPRETPALAKAKKEVYLERYGRADSRDGWRFLTGDGISIGQLTQAVGFRYTWDEASKQYAHPSGIVILTPEGKIARYLFGVEFAPKDVRLGLVEASAGTIGTVSDQAMLFCYKYDPSRGRYSVAVLKLVRVAAVLTIAALIGFIGIQRRRERSALDRKRGDD